MKARTNFSMILAAGLLVATGTARAGGVTTTFSGTIQSIDTMGTGSVPFGVGATFSGSYTYNDAVPYYTTVDNTYVEYQPAQVTIDLVVAGTYDYSRTYAAPVYASYPGAYSDNFVELTTTGPNPTNLMDVQLDSSGLSGSAQVADGEYVELEGKTGLLSSTNLQGLTINTSDLTSAMAVYQSYTYQSGNFESFVNFQGGITTLNGVPILSGAVPEPSGLVSLTCGFVLSFAALLVYKRRKRALSGC